MVTAESKKKKSNTTRTGLRGAPAAAATGGVAAWEPTVAATAAWSGCGTCRPPGGVLGGSVLASHLAVSLC